MANRANSLLRVLLFVFVFLAGFHAVVVAQEPVTAADLLSRIEASRNRLLPPVIFKAEDTSQARLENSKRLPFDSLTTEEFRTDNEQNEARHWWRRFREDGTLDDGHGMLRYNLEKPRRYVQIHLLPNGDVYRPTFSDLEYMPDLAAKYCEPLRIGKYLFGDDKPVVEILRTYTDLTGGDSLENVDGFPCYVLEGSGPCGRYKLWIDPANGYNWRKATVHKSGADLMFGEPMNADPDKPDNPDMAFPMTMSEDLLVEVTNVEISNIEGHFFISKALTTTMERHKGGEIVHIKDNFVLKDVVYNPDFAALGAFKPPIPPGTRIRNIDFPGLPFKWEEGKVVGGLDAAQIDELDQIIDDSKKTIRQNDVVYAQVLEEAAPGQTPSPNRRTQFITLAGAAPIVGIVGFFVLAGITPIAVRNRYAKSQNKQRP